MKKQPDIQAPVPGEPDKERVAAINRHLLEDDDFQKMLIAGVRKSKAINDDRYIGEDNDLQERIVTEAGKRLREENHMVTDDEVREAIKEMISNISWELATASGLYWALRVLRQSDDYNLRLELARELRQALEVKNDEDEGEQW